MQLRFQTESSNKKYEHAFAHEVC